MPKSDEEKAADREYFKKKYAGTRALGTNPKALGTNPRAMGTNPRALADNQWALRAWKRKQRAAKVNNS